ncbi:MAG: hypothetical protein WDN49_17940 [Acetobacteraceae bacterium]
MARSIWTLRSRTISAMREKPTATPRTKPVSPPMQKPAAALSRLIVMSGISVPSSISFTAVWTTLVGAGRICGDRLPRRAAISQATTSTTGTAQDAACRQDRPARREVCRTARLGAAVPMGADPLSVGAASP